MSKFILKFRVRHRTKEPGPLPSLILASFLRPNGQCLGPARHVTSPTIQSQATPCGSTPHRLTTAYPCTGCRPGHATSAHALPRSRWHQPCRYLALNLLRNIKGTARQRQGVCQSLAGCDPVIGVFAYRGQAPEQRPDWDRLPPHTPGDSLGAASSPVLPLSLCSSFGSTTPPSQEPTTLPSSTPPIPCAAWKHLRTASSGALPQQCWTSLALSCSQSRLSRL